MKSNPSVNGFTESTSSVWLDEHAKLIEKLESAYNEPVENKQASSEAIFYSVAIGDLNFLIDSNTSCEVLEENEIYNIPLSEDWLIGVSNIRGDAVPIIDIEYLLSNKYTATNNPNSKTVIIDQAENAIGLIINRLPSSISFKSSQMTTDYSSLPNTIRPYVQYAYQNEGDVWACINLPAFFESISTPSNT